MIAASAPTTGSSNASPYPIMLFATRAVAASTVSITGSPVLTDASIRGSVRGNTTP